MQVRILVRLAISRRLCGELEESRREVDESKRAQDLAVRIDSIKQF